MPIFSEGKWPDPGTAGWLPCLQFPAEPGNGQYSETETPLVLVNRVFWSEGLSNWSSISSKSTHLADKGNCVDIIHADLCVTLDFGRCDSLRTKSPVLCKHQCIVYIQRIKSRLSPLTSLELYLCRLPPRRFRLPGEAMFPRGKRAHEVAEMALCTRSSRQHWWETWVFRECAFWLCA